MGRQWVAQVIKEQLEEAKENGNIEEVRELENLLRLREQRGLSND